MHYRWITIGVTVAAFLLALFGMKFVQQQFFPSSDRSELIIDWNLPQNASIAETNAQMARFEREQLQGNDERRPLVDLCRDRRAAFRAVVRLADGQRLVWADGHRDQGRHRGARPVCKAQFETI